MIEALVQRAREGLDSPSVTIGWDVESHLIQPGCLAPRMVCSSWAARAADGGMRFDLQLREDALMRVRQLLPDPRVVLVVVNAPYDLGVACADDPSLLPLVFDAVDGGRVVDLITRQKLIDIAMGMLKFRRYRGRVVKTQHSLDALMELYYDERVEKGLDTWRLRYAYLDGVPIEEWPEDAKQYAISDAVYHLRIWEAQEAEIREAFPGGVLPNEREQQRAAWALHLMSMWGLRTDPEAVSGFLESCRREIARMHDDLLYSCVECKGTQKDHDDAACPKGRFAPTGIFKIAKRSGEISKTMAEIRRRVRVSCEEQKIQVPMTKPSPTFPQGQIATDKDALLLTNDKYLHILAEQLTFEKHLNQWGPAVIAGTRRNICSRYNVLVESGRTSCSGADGQEGSNQQNPPRKGDVRPCFIPRLGWVFCSTDADVVELCAHGQNAIEMIGWSRTADAIREHRRNGGPDPHEVLGGNLVGLDPKELQARGAEGDPEAKDARQFAKIPQYGLIGALGAETFVCYASAQLERPMFHRWFGTNHKDQIAKAKWIKSVWLETYPENRELFRIIGEMCSGEHGGTIVQLMSGRYRGGTRFTAAANGFMQARVADAMKEILWRLAIECYLGRCTSCDARGCEACGGTGRSVLFGSRPAMFLHDEPILEHPFYLGDAHLRAERQRQVVVEVLNKWMPDVPCTSSAVMSFRWFKGAKPLYIDGKLVPVKPLATVTGIDAAGRNKVKVEWVYDDAGERLALEAA